MWKLIPTSVSISASWARTLRMRLCRASNRWLRLDRFPVWSTSSLTWIGTITLFAWLFAMLTRLFVFLVLLFAMRWTARGLWGRWVVTFLLDFLEFTMRRRWNALNDRRGRYCWGKFRSRSIVMVVTWGRLHNINMRDIRRTTFFGITKASLLFTHTRVCSYAIYPKISTWEFLEDVKNHKRFSCAKARIL